MWTYINVLFCQVFPLDELGAVCGFEAFINGKHIIGEVKEKEKAHKEYQQVGFTLFQTNQLTIMAFSHTIHSVCVVCVVWVRRSARATVPTSWTRKSPRCSP